MIPSFEFDPAKLREKMKLHEVSASDLAKALDVDRSTVSRWLSGDMSPTDDNLEALARALGLARCAELMTLRGMP